MICEVLISLLTVLTSALGVLLWKSWKSNRILSTINGPFKLPLVGNGLDFLPGPEYMTELGNHYIAKYGRRVRINLALSAMVFIANAEDAEKILTSQVCLDKSPEYEMIEPWLGTGLLTAKAKKWKNRRQLLNSSFHFKVMESFISVINDQSQILVNLLNAHVGCGAFDIAPFISNAALDIICETAMGSCKVQAQQNDSLYSEYITAVHRETDLYMRRVLRPWLHPDLLWKLSPSGREEARMLQILHGFTEEVIRERKAMRKVSERSENKASRPAFLDLLLEIQEANPNALITDVDVREEVDTFMFAGHDTSSVNMCWVLLLLASHPHHQELVFQELREIFGAETSRFINMDDLRRMEYLDLCIKESLRLFPSVPSIIRHVTTPVNLDQETVLPKGVSAWIYLQGLHRDPQHFSSPDEFIPERFTAERSVGRHSFAYLPFSSGPRKCLGQKFAMMEEKIIIADIIRNYRIEAFDQWNKLKILTTVVLRPKNGINLLLHKR